jgi:hypothetical protein
VKSSWSLLPTVFLLSKMHKFRENLSTSIFFMFLLLLLLLAVEDRTSVHAFEVVEDHHSEHDHELVDKFYQYGYQVEDFYTGRTQYLPVWLSSGGLLHR